jgi:hypothetical protein
MLSGIPIIPAVRSDHGWSP